MVGGGAAVVMDGVTEGRRDGNWAAIQQGQRGKGWVLVYEMVVVAGCLAVVGRWIWIVTHMRTI